MQLTFVHARAPSPRSNARLNAKIDSKAGTVVMQTAAPSAYEQVRAGRGRTRRMLRYTPSPGHLLPRQGPAQCGQVDGI